MSVGVDEMRQHIEQLLTRITASFEDDAGLSVYWVLIPGWAMTPKVIRDLDGSPLEIQLPKVRSPTSYAVCLHEIGHILGRDQDSSDEQTRECAAWTWAREHALIWTPEMEQEAQASLQHYADAERRTAPR